MPDRNAILQTLADLIVAVQASPVRVAIDGPDAAGKTTVADELAPLVEARGRPVARVSADDFLRPPDERYRRGAESPEGYYLDSFDYDALRARLREPATRAILLVDGVFLLRPELTDLWDFRVFVEIDLEEVLQRALARDVERFGSQEAVRRRYLARYIPAQRRYVEEVEPTRVADVVLDNTDPRDPVLRYSGQATPT